MREVLQPFRLNLQLHSNLNPSMPNRKWFLLFTIYYLPFTIYRLDSKLPSQPQLQTIHFTVIRFVIEAAEVQHAMQNKLRNLLFESEIVFLRLSRGLLYGDDHISQR